MVFQTALCVTVLILLTTDGNAEIDKDLDDCAFLVEKPLMTPSGCIANYNKNDCRGLKHGNLCVVIKKVPEVEVKPGPQAQQRAVDNAVIIPKAEYKTDLVGVNGFDYLTKSENYYVQSVCGQATAPRARIVNGKIATRGQFPWAIDLGFCSGMLISPRHVLTAAHCFYSGPPYGVCNSGLGPEFVNSTIGYGGVCRHVVDNDCPHGSDFRLGKIKRVMYAHNNPYNCIEYNDIAIVLLNEDIEFDEYVKPICLSKLAHDNLINVKSLGFGNVGESKENAFFSKELYSNVLRYFNSNITSIDQTLEIDTHSPDSSICSGDSGGPVQASFNGSSRTYSVGIHSRSYTCDRGETATNTYVPAYVDWVCQQTGVCELD